jgi:hypothetical protein
MRLLVALLVALPACGPTPVTATDGGDSVADAKPGTADANPSRPDGHVDDVRPDANTICAEQDFDIELLPPQLMILLDRSASMTDSLGTSTKWQQAQPAIEHLVSTYQNQILFGFDAFPSSDGLDSCAVTDPVVVDVVDSYANNSSVTAAMWATTPEGGSTPLYCGLNILSESTYAPNFANPAATKYVVVVSDGIDLCGVGCCRAIFPGFPVECSATIGQFEDLAEDLANTHDIKTFVIGFADSSSDEVFEDQLNAIASHGGTPFNEFLLASNQTQLEEALDQIAGEVISCTYAIEDPGEEADPDEVNVYFDNAAVGFDAGCANGAGWDWADASHSAILFCPEACDNLRSLEVDNIGITFGCPTIIVD